MRPSERLDWNDLKLILALAEGGYVSRAAEKLHVDQTTIPRRIRRLEDRLDLKLIERIKGGVVLTSAADDLVRIAREVETGIDDALSAPLEAPPVTGTVKLSGTDFMLDLLMEPLVELQRRFPSLTLDLKPTNDYLSLDRRETDVAIRQAESPHDGLVGRRLPEIPLGIYVPPDLVKAGSGKPWLSWTFPRGVNEIDEMILQHDLDARIVTRVNSFMAQARLCLAGMGCAVLPDRYVAAHAEFADLNRVGSGPSYPAWVVTHEELRHVPRIREVMGAVANGLSKRGEKSE
ncbi:LysR family transcriptional regulator [Actibacterium sp. 188UL27-1]|uniref:LysR family transcriptional regulator n=1 Tax=Actibacterium sp. 188UL27-1 TaxID=2786961 RepID=UPI00195C934C|nr:LysR family transcriptional regulator [Actibacterium sp. 188UL27-1]MBM7070386.1 LysR family transcriptional regulator [Actibacterium sp. 188UL27-1]